MTRRLLTSLNKDEAAVHGCHCPGDLVVRMRKVLAMPGEVGTCASVLKLVLYSAPSPASTRLVCALFLYISFCPEVLTHTVDQNSLDNRYASVGLRELFG